jgi:hypothetical protein
MLASAEYFHEEFPEAEGAITCGEAYSHEGADFTIGATMDRDFESGVVVVDAYLRNDEDPLLVFPESQESQELFMTCVKAALGEIFPDVIEDLQGKEGINAVGLRLYADKHELGTSPVDDADFLDNVEDSAYPIPVDRSRPVHAYLFSFMDAEGTEYEYRGVGAAVFATGMSLGNDIGIPPYWVISSPATLEMAEED